MRARLFTCVHACASLCACSVVCAHMRMHAFPCVCTCSPVCACVQLCAPTCVYLHSPTQLCALSACLQLCTYILPHAHMHLPRCLLTCIHIHSPCAHAHVHASFHVSVFPCQRVCAYACACTHHCMPMRTHTCVCSHTCTHTPTCACAHAHPHAHVLTRKCWCRPAASASLACCPGMGRACQRLPCGAQLARRGHGEHLASKGTVAVPTHTTLQCRAESGHPGASPAPAALHHPRHCQPRCVSLSLVPPLTFWQQCRGVSARDNAKTVTQVLCPVHVPLGRGPDTAPRPGPGQ